MESTEASPGEPASCEDGRLTVLRFNLCVNVRHLSDVSIHFCKTHKLKMGY